MTCPHCNTDVKSPVVETRKYEGGVYRRRSCGNCGRSFITVEKSPVGLKMPAAVVNGKARGQWVQPSRAMSNQPRMTSDGSHLQGLWK